MKITVFGANGKVGNLVVAKLLAEQHHVTAFVHGPTKFSENNNLKIVQGDIYDSDQVSSAIEGTDIVLSALGSWGTPKKDILASAMKNIIPAMQAYNIQRVISLTGSDARAPGDHISVIHRAMHAILGITAGKILRDGETHIQLLAESDLDWTVLRSPIMNEQGTTGYALSNKRPQPWHTIHRHSVVTALVAQIDQTDCLRKSPFLSRT